MKLIPMKDLLSEAKEENRAVAAINASNMETIMGVMEMAEKNKTSIIIQVSPMQLENQKISYNQIVKMIKLFGESYDIKTCIHLDHAMDIESCFEAIDAGFTSVMYDGTLVDFETNIINTKKVVDYAYDKNITVEAELGKVGGVEASDAKDIGYKTNPKDVEIFIEKTNVDCLAVAIGNAHGFYKLEPKLDFELLEEIEKVARIPLVLHGGTGISANDLQKAIKKGIRKINFFTEIDRAYVQGFVKSYEEDNNIYMMSSQEKARQNMMKEIDKKIKIVNCES